MTASDDFRAHYDAVVETARIIAEETRERVREHLLAADALIAELRALGITVELKQSWTARNGGFANIAIVTRLERSL